MDVAGRDVGSYVAEAKERVRESLVALPPGYSLAWSGQYESMQRVKQRLTLIVPLTLFLIFMLLYFNTQSIVKIADHPDGGAVLGRGRDLVAVRAWATT